MAALTNDDSSEGVALWMMKRGYATGHGDTMDDLLSELVLQVWHKSRSPLYCYDPKTGEISLVNQPLALTIVERDYG